MTITNKTLGIFLVELLEFYAVETIFGIPGVHTAELYRGLPMTGIKHLATRHEQGAGFAADGYARVSGKPGVCFVITGPGLTNTLTAMGQAYADSIPMLIISGVNRREQMGMGNGHLHESPNQSLMAEQVSEFSHTLLNAADILPVMARAFAVFESGRARPVHIEIPLDIMTANADNLRLPLKRTYTPLPYPSNASIEAASALCVKANTPLIIAGGGARNASDAISTLAIKLDAPVITTINARGLLANSDPLSVNCSPSTAPVRQLIADSDVVIAIGTEFSPTDFDIYNDSRFNIPGKLIRIDVSAQQLVRNSTPDVSILADAATAVTAINKRVCSSAVNNLNGAARALQAKEGVAQSEPESYKKALITLECIKHTLPSAIIVGDSTQPIYAGNNISPSGTLGSWFNSSVGFGSLGYALPAAIGASLAAPQTPVICIVGDGGFQFSMGELGTAVDADTPIIVIIWNNCGYGEIKNYMLAEGITPDGVDLFTPDFADIGRAYGYHIEQVSSHTALKNALNTAVNNKKRTLLLGVESL